MMCSIISTDGRAGAEHRPPRHLDAVGHDRRNPGMARQVAADEDDAFVRLGGAELDADVPPAPVADPFHSRGRA